MNLDRHAELVGETLQRELPQAHARAVRSAAVRRDDKARGGRIAQAADVDPPSSDRRNRKFRRIAAHADAHPAGIVGQIIDAIRRRPSKLLM